MKIIVVGGTGTIGKAVVNELSQRHEVISVGHSQGDKQVDIFDKKSIEKMYQSIGKFDALVATTGKVHFGALADMTSDHYEIGLKNKLMGQVNLVICGFSYINERGSFTLTSGILNHDPIVHGSSAAMVNGALEGFVKGAVIEMPRGIRLNLVSPTILTESIGKGRYADYFRGFVSVNAAQVALAYSKSIEGAQTGQIYRVGYTVE